MTDQVRLTPANELVKRNSVRFPNESSEYRVARNSLLSEEVELRRHIERVAEQRRALPAGGEVKKVYAFEIKSGAVNMADLFGDKQTLAIYSWMYGPQRKRPCPMCTSLLSAWDGEVKHIEQRIALVAVARSPIQRLVAFKNERGWRDLKVCSDGSGEYTRDYVSAKDADVPGFSVFTRKSGVIRHFWSGEMGSETADPGQDPRGAPDLMSLWTILDSTPEGRGADWYPLLNDEPSKQAHA